MGLDHSRNETTEAPCMGSPATQLRWLPPEGLRSVNKALQDCSLRMDGNHLSKSVIRAAVRTGTGTSQPVEATRHLLHSLSGGLAGRQQAVVKRALYGCMLVAVGASGRSRQPDERGRSRAAPW